MASRTPKAPQTKPAKRSKSAASDDTAKPKATRAKLAKPAPEAAAAPKPQPVAEPAEAAVAPGILKLKELVDAVAAATGGKKPEVKPLVEATLAALGKALATGRAVAAPPLGKIRVVKTKGPALTLKLRLADDSKAAGLALADDGEDG